jgi:hypothetical protein
MSNITTLDLTADIIDVRDIIARVEELESAGYGMPISGDEELKNELTDLRSILAELVGYGGDEQWRGDWYPVTLIQDKYFEDHARELLDDCGLIPKDLPHYIAIDWETTAQNIQVDYTPVEIDGLTYWYR